MFSTVCLLNDKRSLGVEQQTFNIIFLKEDYNAQKIDLLDLFCSVVGPG